MGNKLFSLIKTSLSDGHLSMTLLCTTGVLQKASFSILFSFHSRVLLIAFQITSISTKSYYKLIRYLCLLLYLAAAAAAKTLQSCPTPCDPIVGSPPGPAVPGILQARTLEWVAISSSNVKQG